MAGLLPSKPDIDSNDEPRVVGLDSDDADELIDALSSSTTRAVLAALHEEPASASALATRVDTSLQNVQYHLRKLEDAGLVEVGDTVYSEKGREMNVYVPADRALVVVAGREEETTGLKAALSRLLGGVGVLGLASVVVDRLARGGFSVGFGANAGDAGSAESGDSGADGAVSGGSGGAGGGTAPPEPTSGGDAGASGGAAAPTPEPTPAETVTETATEAATETAGGFQIAEATTTTTAPTEAATVADTAATMTVTPASTATQTTTPVATAMPEPTAAETTTPVATEVVTEASTVAATSPQPGLFDGLASAPGLLFFLGGTTVLVGGFVLWWLRR